MARILSHPYVLIRGSIGGTTYLTNQYHQIVARARTAPVQPQTPEQQLARSYLADASARWSGQTPIIRQAWEDYAQTCQYDGPLHNYTIPGRPMFIACLSRLLNIARVSPVLAVAPIYTAPVIPGFAEIVVGIPGPITPGPAIGFKISVTNPNPDALLVFAWRSIAWPLTRLRYKGPFFTGSILGRAIAAAGSAEFAFPGLTASMHYFVRFTGVTGAVAGAVPHRNTNARIVRALAVQSV